MSPRHQASVQKRKAVVISCEFGIAESRRNEPLAICVVDCLTGDTLVSSLVAVTQPMFNWRKDIHGIGLQQMTAAIKSSQALMGWRAARDKLFEYIDEETVLVGYGIRLPLELFRLYHTKVVDAQVLVTAAVFPDGVPLLEKGRYKSRLPHVCSEFIGITLRQGLHWEAGIHDRLENALAAREIALQCIQRPAELEAWAQRKRSEFWAANPAAKTAYRDISSSRQTNVSWSPLPNQIATSQSLASQTPASQNLPDQTRPDQKSASVALDDQYVTGYKAGFESGFWMGYERGLEKANTRQDSASAEKDLLDEDHSECRPESEKLISLSDDEGEYGNRHESANPSGNHDDDGALATGGLFAELMKDERIRKMVEASSNHFDAQAGTRESEGSMGSTDSWETCRTS
jgi:hypothetical protein